MANNNDIIHRTITMTPQDAFQYALFYEDRGYDVEYHEMGSVSAIDGKVKHSFSIKPVAIRSLQYAA